MSDNGIKLEDAIKSRFETSTREELCAYCDELGVTDYNPRGEIGALKERIFSVLGIDARQFVGGGSAPTPGRVYRSHILPEVNLTPSGLWGGRRRRIMLPRPADATKSENAIPFGWNGKATYWMPFNEVVAIPYPIYNQLRQKYIRRPYQKKVPGADGVDEITTAWNFDQFPFTDYGDDPKTAHLPCSMTEWYQEKGPEFFKGLSERDLTMVCARLDINTMGRDSKRVPQAEMIDLVLIFLFGVSADSMQMDAAESTV